MTMGMKCKVTTMIFHGLLLWIACYQVDGFANNLIVTTVGCMTELDTSEVIMNNVVKSVEDSDLPKMHVVVVDDGDNHIESPYHYSRDEVTVLFLNPYTKEEFSDDLQFVMELLDEADAEWVDGGTIGCDGNRRVAARIQDYAGRATIKIHDRTKVVEILAGWATGHNAVRLTPKLVLQPREGGVADKKPEDTEADNPSGVGNEVVLAKNPDASVLDDAKPGNIHDVGHAKVLEVNDDDNKPKSGAEKGGPRGESSQNNDKAEQRKMGHVKQKEKRRQKGESNNDQQEVRQDIDKIKVRSRKDFIETAKKLKKARTVVAASADAAGKENDDRAVPSSEDEEELQPIKHRNSIADNNAKFSEKERRKQLEKQMEENFPARDYADRLDTSAHLFACAFFLLSMGSIVIFLGKKREKGRRDL